MMKATTRAIFLVACSVSYGSPALSRDASPEDASQATHAPDAIVVTATKKAAAEDAQVVPLAINAFDAAALDARKVRDLTSLSYAIPGVSLDQVGTFRGVANWSIRGLGINSSIASIEPAVGTVVDGVYLGINPGAALDLFDLDSVEILRGPQGTLFGRNTTGGAVLVNTANPSNTWLVRAKLSAEGPVDAGRGAMEGRAEAVISGPVGAGFSFRLGAFHDSDGGYFRNLYDGNAFGKAETTILRAGLSYQSAGVHLVAKAEFLDTYGDGAPGQNHGLFARNSFDISLDNRGFIRARSWLGTVRGDIDLPDGVVTNIFGYRDFRQFTNNDIDSTPNFLFHSGTGLTQNQWSNELRYAGSHGPFDIVSGGYLFHQDIAYEEDRTIPPNPKFYGGGRQGHDVYGLFTSVDYRVTRRLTLNAGVRWSHEAKAAEVTFVRPRTACSVIEFSCPISGTNSLVPGEPNGFSDKRSTANWSPKIGASLQMTADAMAYASWSRASRAGGYNLRITQPAAFLALGNRAFDDERVDSYEIGLKLVSSDRRATLNLAGYRSDIQGVQREVSVSSVSSGLAQSVYNTADARIWGGEVESSFQITPNVKLSANLAYIDAKYTKVNFDISGDGTISAADYGLELPRAPRWTYGAVLEHRIPLGGDASIVNRIAFQHRDRVAYTDNNFGWIDAADMLDATVTWNLPVKGLSIAVYGRNLLDQVQFGGDTQIPFGGSLSDGNNRPFDPTPAAGTFSPLGKGRLIGAEVSLSFK